MYPVALYGSVPEAAYLAPRGDFVVPALAEEDGRRLRWRWRGAPQRLPNLNAVPGRIMRCDPVE